MNTCASCKNKTSLDRCKNRALNGTNLCGIHIKNKSPRLWSVVNDLDKHATTISKNWKRYIIRKRLNLAGPGVLNRKICSNQEEINTLEDIKTVSPFDYFGFEQDGQTYGFDIRSIVTCLHEKHNSTNPFNRQPFPMEARQRLRKIYGYRIRHKLDNYYRNDFTVEQIHKTKWIQICQMIEENGFTDTTLTPNVFLSLNKFQLSIFLKLIHMDMIAWASELKQNPNLRTLHSNWIGSTLRRNSYMVFQSQFETSYSVAHILRLILYDSVEPYNVCFMIMSALYRL